jgi:hypothetical protein
MIILGLLLLVIAIGFGVDFVWKNDVHIANPTVFGERLGIHSAASLFVVGAITGAVILLGCRVAGLGSPAQGCSRRWPPPRPSGDPTRSRGTRPAARAGRAGITLD